jgi:hypothetical protein
MIQVGPNETIYGCLLLALWGAETGIKLTPPELKLLLASRSSEAWYSFPDPNSTKMGMRKVE